MWVRHPFHPETLSVPQTLLPALFSAPAAGSADSRSPLISSPASPPAIPAIPTVRRQSRSASTFPGSDPFTPARSPVFVLIIDAVVVPVIVEGWVSGVGVLVIDHAVAIAVGIILRRRRIRIHGVGDESLVTSGRMPQTQIQSRKSRGKPDLPGGKSSLPQGRSSLPQGIFILTQGKLTWTADPGSKTQVWADLPWGKVILTQGKTLLPAGPWLKTQGKFILPQGKSAGKPDGTSSLPDWSNERCHFLNESQGRNF